MKIMCMLSIVAATLYWAANWLHQHGMLGGSWGILNGQDFNCDSVRIPHLNHKSQSSQLCLSVITCTPLPRVEKSIRLAFFHHLALLALSHTSHLQWVFQCMVCSLVEGIWPFSFSSSFLWCTESISGLCFVSVVLDCSSLTCWHLYLTVLSGSSQTCGSASILIKFAVHICQTVRVNALVDFLCKSTCKPLPHCISYPRNAASQGETLRDAPHDATANVVSSLPGSLLYHATEEGTAELYRQEKLTMLTAIGCIVSSKNEQSKPFIERQNGIFVQYMSDVFWSRAQKWLKYTKHSCWVWLQLTWKWHGWGRPLKSIQWRACVLLGMCLTQTWKSLHPPPAYPLTYLLFGGVSLPVIEVKDHFKGQVSSYRVPVRGSMLVWIMLASHSLVMLEVQQQNKMEGVDFALLVSAMWHETLVIGVLISLKSCGS